MNAIVLIIAAETHVIPTRRICFPLNDALSFDVIAINGQSRIRSRWCGMKDVDAISKARISSEFTLTDDLVWGVSSFFTVLSKEYQSTGSEYFGVLYNGSVLKAVMQC